MMAKEPRRRFQTPGEVAQAIVPFLQERSRAAPTSNAALAPERRDKARLQPATSAAPAIRNQAPTTHPEPSWESLIKFKEPETLRDRAVEAQRRRRRWMWSATVAAVLLALVIAWALFVMPRS